MVHNPFRILNLVHPQYAFVMGFCQHILHVPNSSLANRMCSYSSQQLSHRRRHIQEHTVGYARNLLLEMCTTQIHLVLLFSVLEDGLLRLDFLQKLAEEKIMRKKIEMLNNHEIDI